ncbi:MAG TPA: SH3 domain-containing protein [Rudaea sp.]|nr:SH3 domain-containing protein [Rudaea sp.]
MKRILAASMLGCSVLAAASSAFAGQGYLIANVTLRAGPDMGYPSVVGLRAGTPVGIEGCVDGWSWCDVTAGYDRGWVSANYLQEDYQGQRVLVPQYGVQIGIPIVSFVFGSYWDNYYSNRSWYHNRDHWSHVQPHYITYGGSHGTSYGSSYSGSHANSYGGGTHYVAPNQARASSTYHTSGTRQSTVVTAQPTYQNGRTRTTYQNGYTQSASQGRQTGSVTHAQSAEGRQTGSVTHSLSVEGRQTGSVTHTGSKPSEGRDTRSYANRTTSMERNAESSHGANVQHGAPQSNGAAQRNSAQSRTVAEHKQQAPKAAHKDGSTKPEKDNGGGKDKNRN